MFGKCVLNLKTTNKTGETGMTQITFSSPVPDGRESCATKYPLVLLHGLSYRDDMALLASWGRIPDVLTEAGAKVFLGGLQAWDTIEYVERQYRKNTCRNRCG